MDQIARLRQLVAEKHEPPLHRLVRRDRLALLVKAADPLVDERDLLGGVHVVQQRGKRRVQPEEHRYRAVYLRVSVALHAVDAVHLGGAHHGKRAHIAELHRLLAAGLAVLGEDHGLVPVIPLRIERAYHERVHALRAAESLAAERRLDDLAVSHRERQKAGRADIVETDPPAGERAVAHHVGVFKPHITGARPLRAGELQLLAVLRVKPVGGKDLVHRLVVAPRVDLHNLAEIRVVRGCALGKAHPGERVALSAHGHAPVVVRLADAVPVVRLPQDIRGHRVDGIPCLLQIGLYMLLHLALRSK